MVLPGWNVSEPLSAAVKFAIFVRKYRDAPDEIQEFAAQLDAFRQVLEAFDACRKHPESVDIQLRQRLNSVSESCRLCAENCKTFIDKFFNQYEKSTPAGIGAGNRLLWVWNKEKAISLGKKMGDQVTLISVHTNLAEWYRPSFVSFHPAGIKADLHKGEPSTAATTSAATATIVVASNVTNPHSNHSCYALSEDIFLPFD